MNQKGFLGGCCQHTGLIPKKAVGARWEFQRFCPGLPVWPGGRTGPCSKALVHFLAAFLQNSGVMQPTWERDGEMRESLFLFRSAVFSSPKTGDEYLDLPCLFWTDPSQGFLQLSLT